MRSGTLARMAMRKKLERQRIRREIQDLMLQGIFEVVIKDKSPDIYNKYLELKKQISNDTDKPDVQAINVAE